MKLFLKISYCILLCSFFKLEAQEIVPLQNHAPNVYGAENQNWDISQNSDKVIYVANNSGLLEYNGASWQLYPSPNSTILRSVSVINELVYTGAHMEFGSWKKNAFGKLKYTSISKKLKEPLLEDEQFWNIIEFEKWILFQSLNRIYIYDTQQETFKIINSKTVLEKAFRINKSIYFQKSNDGLYKIENGEELLISDASILKNNAIIGMYSQNEKLLLLTQEKGFYHIDLNGSLTKWEIECQELLASISVYSSTKMYDGSFVLGTISNGIYHLNKEGTVVTNINQEKGLYNNTVLSIFEDSDHNIWAGLDNGISTINLTSPYKVYNDVNGKLGTVYTSAVFEKNIYLGTNQGLFYKKLASIDEFQFIEGTEGQVWCLNIIDDKLFCGHNKGTYLIKEQRAEKIASIQGTWNLKKIPDSKNLLLQGNYNGLYVLEKKEGQWTFRNKIEGFDNSSRFFEFSQSNEIFVSHEYKGIFELKVDTTYTKVINFKIDASKKGKRSSLTKYHNKLIYSYKNGIFKYDTLQNTFVKDSFLSNGLSLNENYVSGKLITTANDRLWGFTDNSIVYFSPGKFNNTPEITKIPLPAITRRDYPGYENVTHLKETFYLFGTSYGYIIIDINKLIQKEYKIHINNISKGILNDIQTSIPLTNNDKINYSENNLNFYFSVPTYDKYAEIRYQYKLTGIYNEWSNWSKESQISFKNLPFGDYTFEVKSKIGNTNTNKNAVYKFTIKRPWYLSNGMIALYILICIVLFVSIHHSYKQYYKKQKKNLLDKKQREFERSQLENEKEIMKLRNDKLRNDINSKNRELAASTMSIIKKNEFLNTIKKELSDVKNNDLIKPIIKIIDKNLNHDSDWKLFQEAFNNADKDFLKKVSERHPKLTPNDLRLCAYLRLNLSSKEIAPLLNISHKSVEIKRYRLRKKMNLDSKDNLIHHILEI